jgi:TP53 regulating kinase and related kinases
MELISRGAEAEIYLDKDKIIKKRIAKSYRIKELDSQLRKFRTKREAKIIQKLPKEIPHPELLNVNDTSMTIEMSLVKGEKVRDILDKNVSLCVDIGKKIALMHNAGIIHGDLTTSNMIYQDKLHFIDFGLSFFSEKVEDRAVDLHLLKQALESKHYRVFEEAFSLVMKGYKSESETFKEVKARFDQVELRGRNKAKF